LATPGYAVVTASGQASWTWASSTADVRALQKPSAVDRIAACWYSSAPFLVDINITDSAVHQVALYMVDWDYGGRSQTVEVLDAIGNILDRRSVTGFAGGQYLVWNISGHVRFRISRVIGSSAMLSGLMFGEALVRAPAKMSAVPRAATNGTALVCPPQVASGEAFGCRIELGGNSASEPAELHLVSSNDNVQVPSMILVDPGRSTVAFHGAVRAGAGQESADIAVRAGDTLLQTTVEVMADPVALEACARVPAISRVQRAARPARPLVQAVWNAASRASEPACSAGAIATVAGIGLLLGDPLVAPDGRSTELGGTQVKINGEAAPVLHASRARVDFLCPAVPAGTPLEIVVETGAGTADPVATVAAAASPRIFLADYPEQKQGLVLFSGTSTIAAVADYRSMRRPARAGDSLSVRVTGISPTLRSVLVRVDGLDVEPMAIRDVELAAGLSEVVFELPSGIEAGMAVPLSLLAVLEDGAIVESNAVTIAVQ
jgi:uncharacterized protein (TIGR03437 family)